MTTYTFARATARPPNIRLTWEAELARFVRAPHGRTAQTVTNR